MHDDHDAHRPPDARLGEVAQLARAAEDRGDEVAANEAWRRYRLIRDAHRDPDELLAEGIEFSVVALALRDEA